MNTPMPKLLPALRHLRIGLFLLVLLAAFLVGAAHDLVQAAALLPPAAPVNAAVVKRLLLHAAVAGAHLAGSGAVFAVLNFYKLAVPEPVARAVNANPLAAYVVRWLQEAMKAQPTFEYPEIPATATEEAPRADQDAAAAGGG